MFRTLIFSFAALILGMLLYLYNEISALRQAPPQRIILTVEDNATVTIQPVGSAMIDLSTCTPGRYLIEQGSVTKIEEAPPAAEPQADMITEKIEE